MDLKTVDSVEGTCQC